MDEILKYQDIDIQIKKLEAEVANSDAKQNASKMQQYLKDCQTKLAELNNKSEAIVNNYEQLEKVYKDMTDKLNVVSKSVDSASEKKLESLSEAAGAILSNLSKLEKELNNASKQLSGLFAEYENIMRNATTAKKNFVNYKDSYMKLKESKEPEIAKLQKELKDQEKKVDKVILQKYLAKHNEKTLPIIVKEINGRCGGCRMEIAGRSMEKLKHDKFLECENCGRIIFID